MKKVVFFLVFIPIVSYSQDLSIAKLQYDGGGDWYSNKTALPNLIEFCNANLSTNLNSREEIVEVGNTDIFLYPLVYMTGHGNVVFSNIQARNLRNYLIGGGFLHIDDNYGMDAYVRKEMKKVFPELDFIELPFDHPIYHQKYDFDNGLPKIHQHDGQPAAGFGLIWEGQLVCFYSHESDLGNGWEDQSIYNDPEPLRLQALQMGANIISFVFSDLQ